MKNKKQLHRLKASRKEVKFPDYADREKFSLWTQELREVIDANLGHTIANALKWDECAGFYLIALRELAAVGGLVGEISVTFQLSPWHLEKEIERLGREVKAWRQACHTSVFRHENPEMFKKES